MGVRAGLAFAVTVLALASCSDKPEAPRSAEISRTSWQSETNRGIWPFTVDQGVLACHAPDWVTFTANGTEYALSDNARWVGRYPDVAPILVKGYVQVADEQRPVPTSFESVTDRGRELCP